MKNLQYRIRIQMRKEEETTKFHTNIDAKTSDKKKNISQIGQSIINSWLTYCHPAIVTTTTIAAPASAIQRSIIVVGRSSEWPVTPPTASLLVNIIYIDESHL